jgi:glyoxalase family protein
MTELPGDPPATDPSGAPGARRMRLRGVHHVTMICADLARVREFYGDLLGLTLVREADNDDDPGARHFWFGDADGSPGTLVSFLEYPAMDPGSVGRGSTHHVAFHVGSREELDAWRAYLEGAGVACSEILERGGLRSLYFRDPDGHLLEIAAA